MKCKEGVTVYGLRQELIFASFVADTVYHAITDSGVVITAAVEDGHNSYVHLNGCAIDIRTRYPGSTRQFSADLKTRLMTALKDALTDEFDIVLEDNHIHIELDRR